MNISDPNGRATGELSRAMTAHTLDVLRFEAGQRKKAFALLDTIQRDAERLLRSIDPTGTQRESVRQRRLKRLIAEARTLIRQAYRTGTKEIQAELKALTGVEAALASEALADSLAGIGQVYTPAFVTAQNLSRVTSSVLVEGAPMKEWWARQAGDLAERFTDQMRAGITSGETLSQLTQRIRGGRHGGVTLTGIMQTTQRHAEALVRTSAMAYANEGRIQGLLANADILDALVHLSTLDSRTTDICAGRDLKAWTVPALKPIDHTRPFRRPPLHWKCRSTMTARIQGATKAIGQRASSGGPVGADVSFEQWLKTRSRAQQDKQFGKAKMELWRAGKLSLPEMVDFWDRPLTLPQLEEKIKRAA